MTPIAKESSPDAGTDDERKARTRIKRRRMLLGVLMALYLLLLALLSYSNAVGPDQWWWSSLNLYLPQWPWALPGLLLLLLYLCFDRRRAWIPLLALWWAVGPIMGLCWHWPRVAHDGANPIRLRVMTYNIKGDRRDPATTAREIAETKPDLLLIQEAHSNVEENAKRLGGDWHIYRNNEYLIATRLPLLTADLRFAPAPMAGFYFLRCQLQVGRATVTVITVHLISPRGGLATLRHRRADGVDDFEGNIAARVQQAGMLADLVRQEQGPIILTGDLNAPVQSLACRQLFDRGLRDAFSDAGWGYGYTYGQFQKLRHPYIRIDHILVNDAWRVERCWPGNAVASDHRPVFADLVLSDTP